MKRKIKLSYILSLLLVTISIISKAQIALEQDYDTAQFQLSYIKLQHYGEKYAWVSNPALGAVGQATRKINLYNLNHSLWKTINIASMPYIPKPLGSNNTSILFISDSLFATDTLIEFMYTGSYGDTIGLGVITTKYQTTIYNENMVQLFTCDCGLYRINNNDTPSQFTEPIFNTSQGTKMILNSISPYKAKVYSLPGMYINANKSYVLSDAQIPVTSERMNIYPNPSFDYTTISYSLPIDIETAKMVFYDLNGKMVKSFTIDHTFTNLRLSVYDLNAGSYYCQVEGENRVLSSKKLIKIN